jgi:hypothetical protein
MGVLRDHKLAIDWVESTQKTQAQIFQVTLDRAATDARLLLRLHLFSQARCAFLNISPGNECDSSTGMFTNAEALDCLYSCVADNIQGLHLAGQSVSYDRPRVRDLVSPGNWFVAFCVNTICRRRAAIQRLARVPEDCLNNPEIQEPDVRREFFRAVVLALHGADDLAVEQQLLQAQQATDPDREDVFNPEYILSFDVYWIHLTSMIVRRDEAGFAETLTAALEKHKAYWRKSKKRRMNSDGFLATNLIGLAAWGWEKGFRFEIESDYLPMRFVTGEFLKDVPYAQTSQ